MLQGLVLFATKLETADTSEVTVLNNARLLSTRRWIQSLLVLLQCEMIIGQASMGIRTRP